MKLRHIIIIAVFILINVAVLMTLNFGGKEKVDEKEAELFVQVLEATEISNSTEQFKVEGFGTISSFNRVDVSTEVQGKLNKGSKHLKPGVNFRKGETLFYINDTEARYNIRSRKSSFINIMAQLLPDIKVDFSSEYEKWENYVSSIKLNEALPVLPAWKSNKEKIFLSTRNVLTEYFAIKGLEEQLRKYYVSAPYNGVITEVFVSDQSVVNPGTRVLTFAQTDNFEVAVSVPASSIGSIEIGTKTNIYSTSGELKGVGTVVRISEVINKSTQAVDVFVSPEAVEGKNFIEGEYVKVAINEIGEYQGVRIPLNALMENQVYTYSKSDSTLAITEVNVLNENASGVFVGGLKDGSIVITQEVQNYTDSTKYGVLIR